VKRNLSERSIPMHALAAPDHILVAIDSSDADFLVSYAIAQAKRNSAKVTLLHAIVPMNAMAIEGGAVPFINDASCELRAQHMLRELSRDLATHGIDCDIMTRHGYAATVICDELRRTGATRLIMGTHGRKHLAQFALGSVAEEVLRHADVPVFAVGPHAHRKAGREIPRKILHPVSLTGHYQASVKFAMDLARIHHAELQLLHVLHSDLESSAEPGQSLDWAENAMANLVAGEIEDRPEIQTSATFGNVIREILFAAAVSDADWIVVGVHGGNSRWPLNNSTAYRVLAEANCPVLTVPHHI
jgi:nucleotide-binding universal stress UspA family protein